MREGRSVPTARADVEVRTLGLLQPQRHIVASHRLRAALDLLDARSLAGQPLDEIGLLLCVDDGRRAFGPLDRDLAAQGGAYPARDLLDALGKALAGAGVEGPERAFELYFLGDDVEGRAAVDAGEADDAVVDRVGLARHQRLQ